MIEVNLILKSRNSDHYIKNPDKFIEKKIENFNKKFKRFRKKKIFFTLLLSGDKEIKKLNKKFRNKNKTTDVLSFPFYNKSDLKKNLNNNREIYLGDIIINLNKIKNRNDKKTFTKEFDKLWIHGFVHLFGYDHQKNVDYEKMIKIEKKFLSYL